MTTDRRSAALPDHLFFGLVSGACALAFAAYLAMNLTTATTQTAAPAAIQLSPALETTGAGRGS